MPVLSNDEFENYGAPAGAAQPQVLSTDEFENFKPADKPLAWSDVPGQALANAPGSAVQFAKDVVQPILHPIDTVENIGKVGAGLANQLGIGIGGPDPEADQAWDQFKGFFKDRYGSVEGFKKALATDPVGVLGDASILLSGGETALARAPGLVGKVGRAAGEVAAAPGRAAGALTRGAGNLAAEGLGLTTGAGAEPIKAALRTGIEGGGAGEAFRAGMRGERPLEDVVSEARGAVDQMRVERGQGYREAMADIGMDTKVLNFDKIDDAMREAGKVQTYKGQDLSPTTQAVRYKLADIVDEWRALDPYEFHTAEGLDALKRKVGDIRDATELHTPERVVADRVYNAIRGTIVKQAPDYGRAMEAYAKVSDTIKQIERTLSLNPNANIDTALRKLLAVTRDNVSTNFGYRKQLVEILRNSGAEHLLDRIMGHALGHWAPRGIARVGAGLATAGLGALSTPALAALPAMSPRLVGEAAHAVGRGASYLRRPAQLAAPGRLRALGIASQPPQQEPKASRLAASFAARYYPMNRQEQP
ncbi:hypothetical protein [Bradyrhizobium sp. SZCCHNR1098]|uniref:hypothetical protein n=1 Tax=Bradyrhizobium sp. SZCCHNR1098 TaxID=3057370 RepID=UPI0029169A37|nr:hypothetical protein [Bradyrhizobium sp. SZCCHNR1098]